MDAFSLTEDALLEIAREKLGTHIREYDSVGGSWTVDMLRRALARAPAIYVAFVGSTDSANQPDHQDARFVLYVITASSRGESYRRRGDGHTVGAYQILNALCPALRDRVVEDVGTLKLKAVRNLFQEVLFDLGGTVYGIEVSVPLDFIDAVDEQSLDDFITFDADYDPASEDDGRPAVRDHLTVQEQEN